jgi:hypothetical protein
VYQRRVCGVECGDVVGQDQGLAGDGELGQIAVEAHLIFGKSPVQAHEVLPPSRAAIISID